MSPNDAREGDEITKLCPDCGQVRRTVFRGVVVVVNPGRENERDLPPRVVGICTGCDHIAIVPCDVED